MIPVQRVRVSYIFGRGCSTLIMMTGQNRREPSTAYILGELVFLLVPIKINRHNGIKNW